MKILTFKVNSILPQKEIEIFECARIVSIVDWNYYDTI